MSAHTNSTVTLLFTDVEGSTSQWETSADMHIRVEQHFSVLRSCVADAGGEIFATLGDGIAAAFRSADAAVQAAISAQRRMPAVGLRARMGIHTGDAERVGDDYRGRAVNRAARVMAVGHGGQILLSDLTASLIRTGPDPLELVDLGTHRLRDLTDAERLWQVVHPDIERRFPVVRGADAYSHNLPIQRSSLVGREQDVGRVVDLVLGDHVVTLTGVGGVGKTRLAVQAAAELLPTFGDVRFVELASIVDPSEVASAIAQSMGLGGGRDALVAVQAVLSGQHSLLVVDNCEHVIDSVADVVDALVGACARLSVIVTSREALGIDGEHVVRVRSLDPASTAIELFRQRAAAAGAELDDVDDAELERICRRLDGIPLAIEIAAARSATLGIAAINGALDDRFTPLGGGRQRAVDRHSTMRATIDWSYRLLGDDEQQFLQRLAVFPNGVEMDAAVHVAASLRIGEWAAIEHVSSLVHKNMLLPESLDQVTRYRMLETMRDFALEQLEAGGQRHVAQLAMTDWVATITDLPYEDSCTAAVERNSIRLEREVDNWRDAVLVATRLGDAELAARLCGAPVAFFLLGRHDLAHLVRPMLAVCVPGSRQRRAVLCATMVSAAGAADPAQLVEWADEMDALERDHPTGLACLMRWLAGVSTGDYETVVATCIDGSLDPRFPQGTRDMLLGIAVLDRFSLTEATQDPHGLIDRAIETADRSDVALHRVSCRLGAAWGLAGRRPEMSLELIRRALADIDSVPALTRLTLPGNASRLLAAIDPRIAARGLLDQLGATSSRRSFVDLIPLSYATALLDRVGHPAAGAVLAEMAGSPLAPYASMMDFVDIARRTALTNSPVSLSELEVTVRAALLEIAEGELVGSGG